MNKVILSGYVGKEVSVRESQSGMKVARCSLGVSRMKSKDGEQGTDWISLIAFDKRAEFFERYVTKGTKLLIEGHINTGSYTNKENLKVYTTDVIVDSCEFAQSKKDADSHTEPAPSTQPADTDGFVNVPDGIDDELPFN